MCVCVRACACVGDESSETMTRIPACISLETTLTKCISGLISIFIIIIFLLISLYPELLEIEENINKS